MRGTLRLGHRTYEIADRGSSMITTPRIGADRAASLVRRAQWEPAAMRTLRGLLGDRTRRLSDAQVVDRIGVRLRGRRLEMRQVPERRVALPRPEPVAEESAEETPAESSITIRVIDDETEEGIQGVELQVVLPGATDPTSFRTAASTGEVRIDGIHPGSCDIAKMLDEHGYEVVRFES